MGIPEWLFSRLGGNWRGRFSYSSADRRCRGQVGRATWQTGDLANGGLGTRGTWQTGDLANENPPRITPGGPMLATPSLPPVHPRSEARSRTTLSIEAKIMNIQ